MEPACTSSDETPLEAPPFFGTVGLMMFIFAHEGSASTDCCCTGSHSIFLDLEWLLFRGLSLSCPLGPAIHQPKAVRYARGAR